MKKYCHNCRREFEPSRFHSYQKYCLNDICIKERNNKKAFNWRNKDIEHAREIMRKYDKSEKRKIVIKRRYPKIRAYIKEWLRRNPNKTAEYDLKNRLKNPEQNKINRKKYEQSLKGKFLNRLKSSLKRKLSKLGLDMKAPYYNNELAFIAQIEQQMKCPLCNTEYGADFRNVELGHIYSISKYPHLGKELKNIIPICKECNGEMSNKFFADYCKEKNYPIPKRVLDYINKIENSVILINSI